MNINEDIKPMTFGSYCKWFAGGLFILSPGFLFALLIPFITIKGSMLVGLVTLSLLLPPLWREMKIEKLKKLRKEAVEKAEFEKLGEKIDRTTQKIKIKGSELDE